MFWNSFLSQILPPAGLRWEQIFFWTIVNKSLSVFWSCCPFKDSQSSSGLSTNILLPFIFSPCIDSTLEVSGIPRLISVRERVITFFCLHLSYTVNHCECVPTQTAVTLMWTFPSICSLSQTVPTWVTKLGKVYLCST